MLELTDKQQEIHDALVDWVYDPYSEYTALSGYAGTGKTTLLGEVAKTLQDFSINFITYTGKASTVLAQKLANSGVNMHGSSCGTIHSLMYLFDGELRGKLTWRKKNYKQLELGDLIIVDEASMLTPKIFNDLLNLGRPIIFVGDPGQLPPIDAQPFLPLQNTEFKLEEIHRQAWDNPIIQIATRIRQGEEIPYGVYGNKAAKMNKPQSRQLVNSFKSSVIEDTNRIFLCGRNNTRIILNRSVRAKASLPETPQPGEYIICLKNNKELQLMNGTIFKLQDIREAGPLYKVLPEGSSEYTYCHKNSFNSKSPQELKEKLRQDSEAMKCIDDLMYYDYAYAITVHKSQGSEWDNVILYDERMHFFDDDTYRKWLYTGVTRAKEKLLIIK